MFPSFSSFGSAPTIGAWRIPPSSKRSETRRKAGSKLHLVCWLRGDKNECLVRERGLNAQYWGISVNRANEFFWLLCKCYDMISVNDAEPDPPDPRRAVWQSHAHSTAIKADPSYPTFVHDREALATAPVFDIHVPFSGNPQRTLEAPVTEMSFYKTDDREVNPDVRPAAETQELIRHITYRIESLQLQGFIALSWGIAIEDGTRGVYLAGWKSIEVRLLALSHSFIPLVQNG
jgi:hypothetical protein